MTPSVAASWLNDFTMRILLEVGLPAAAVGGVASGGVPARGVGPSIENWLNREMSLDMLLWLVRVFIISFGRSKCSSDSLLLDSLLDSRGGSKFGRLTTTGSRPAAAERLTDMCEETWELAAMLRASSSCISSSDMLDILDDIPVLAGRVPPPTYRT